MPEVVERERVGRIDAPRVRASAEIDARVVRIAAVIDTSGDAIGKCVHAGDAAVGIQITQFRGLGEAHAAGVVGRAAGKLMAHAAAAPK